MVSPILPRWTQMPSTLGLLVTPRKGSDVVNVVEQVLKKTPISHHRVRINTRMWEEPYLMSKTDRAYLQSLSNASRIAIDVLVLGSPNIIKISPLADSVKRQGTLLAAGLPSQPDIQLGQALEPSLSFNVPDISSICRELYDENKTKTYSKHGLKFHYMPVTRSHFPYLVEAGAAGLYIDGMRFVMEDYWIKNRPEVPKKFIELVAIHEFGEEVLGSHHDATLLELAIAFYEGILGEYIAFLRDNNFLKFRDIVLNRIGKKMGAAPDEDPSSNRADKDNPYYGAIKEIITQFQALPCPSSLIGLENELDEDEDLARQKIEKWEKFIVVNEQIRMYLQAAVERSRVAAINVSLEEGVPIEEIRKTISLAFYDGLWPLLYEIENDILPSEYIQISEVEKALKQLNDPSLFSRSFEEHLRIVKMEQDWFAAFHEEELVNDNDKESREQSRRHFWNLVFSEISRGKNEKDALEIVAKSVPVIAKLYEEFKKLKKWMKELEHFPFQAEEYSEMLKMALIASFSRVGESSNELENLDDSTLQVMTDLFTEKILQKNSFGISLLRENYGKKFERFLDLSERGEAEYKHNIVYGLLKRFLKKARQEQCLEKAESLEAKLSDETWYVRQSAVSLFVQVVPYIAPEKQIQGLKALLNVCGDEWNSVRSSAVYGITSLYRDVLNLQQCSEFLAVLVNNLKSSEAKVRGFSAKILAEMIEQRKIRQNEENLKIVEKVEVLLDDSNPGVREEAILSISRILPHLEAKERPARVRKVMFCICDPDTSVAKKAERELPLMKKNLSLQYDSAMEDDMALEDLEEELRKKKSQGGMIPAPAKICIV